MKINCYLLNNNGFDDFIPTLAKNIFPSAGRKYNMHISRGASGNPLFPTEKILTYTRLYTVLGKTNFIICFFTYKYFIYHYKYYHYTIINDKPTNYSTHNIYYYYYYTPPS